MSAAGAAVASDAGLACPRCQGHLDEAVSALTCARCGRTFDRPLGIPDLRLSYPDPYSSASEDHAAARTLADAAPNLGFPELLREHWRMTGKAAKLVERFVAGDLAARERAESYVGAVEQRLGRALGPDDRVLEVGCGTAALAAAGARRGSSVVATDVSLRWLVLAAKRVDEEDVSVGLVCCAVEALPFADESFDVVIAGDVIEHVADQRMFARECARVLRPGGLLFLATPNRYSLGLEPHVRLWGVGLLPRGLAKAYVERVRRTPYDHVRLLSSFALRRLLRRAGFDVAIEAPRVPEASHVLARGLELRLVRAYNAARRIGAIRIGLLAVGPFFHVFALKRSS